MFEKIKDWWERRKLEKYRNTHYISPKGEMILNYILNKYVNATKPADYIEDYESRIQSYTPRFIEEAQAAVIERNPKAPEGVDPERVVWAVAHWLAALHVFSCLLALMPLSKQNDWYVRIEDDDMHDLISGKVERIRL